jgi:hypothetical protein
MKAFILEVHMAMTGSQLFLQKPSAFDCGTNDLCKGGTSGSSWLETIPSSWEGNVLL